MGFRVSLREESMFSIAMLSGRWYGRVAGGMWPPKHEGGRPAGQADAIFLFKRGSGKVNCILLLLQTFSVVFLSSQPQPDIIL